MSERSLHDDQLFALGLAGHNHRASTHSARDLATRAGPALVIQAGTATSTRLRDEEQSFNQIDIEGEDVVLTVQAWGGSGFIAVPAMYPSIDMAQLSTV